MDSIRIGSFVLPAAAVWLLLAYVAGLAVAAHVQKRQGWPGRIHADGIFLAAMLAARLAYVLPRLDDYTSPWWAIVDIRDGGWHATAGIVAAWAWTGWQAWRKPVQRLALLTGLGTATAIWLGAAAVSEQIRTADRQELPSLTVQDLRGRNADIRDYLGKPLVINLWATWCPPCRREMPAFAAVQAQHPEVNIVFLNQGETASAVQAFLQETHLQAANILLDNASTLSRSFKAKGLPTTLFFDAQGVLADVRMGELSQATLRQRIEALAPAARP